MVTNPAPMVASLRSTTLAQAKINLSLDVLYRRDDGYHELVSLVTFADFGDSLELDCTQVLGLSIEGDNLSHIGKYQNNLILKAAYGFKTRFPDAALGHFNLIKRIPIAAGLGGGSADAAAALRLLARVNNIDLDDPTLYEIAMQIGADVPVCLTSKTRFMSGIGEKLSDVVELPCLWAVLVNPHIAVSTAEVFGKLKVPLQGKSIATIDLKFDNNSLFTWLERQKNDLQAPAVELHPKIAEVLVALAHTSNPHLVRMSGSGATCFALYASEQAAIEAEALMKQTYPDWWVKAVGLNEMRV
jgi:4-diphosphocytidyl-2-C-methyl-D-erythritol kinase